jgi:hypothetical protein
LAQKAQQKKPQSTLRSSTIKMRKSLAYFSAMSILLTASASFAVTVSGTVTNKTNGKPSAGDAVDLVDVQAGMANVAHATTDANGRYSFNSPAAGAYLVRVNHQGGSYFIAAPQGGGPGDVSVYDVAAKVDGVSIDADMYLIEAASGILRVHERYLIRNTSLPPRAQFSNNPFEIVLPSGAEVDSASATRPGGLGTNTRLVPLNQKGHYTFNVPIQPDQGEKETLFEVMYHIAYNGKFTFSPQLLMPADNLVVYAAKGISFKAGSGASFETRQEDPRVDTWVTKNIRPGQSISFSISGEGQMPAQSASGDRPSMGAVEPSSGPGGGIGAPIGTPDPLTKYKWWILSFLTILLIAAATFMLRKRAETLPATSTEAHIQPTQARTPTPKQSAPISTGTAGIPAPVASVNHSALLAILKDELFAIESERLSGSLSESEYTQIKSGLEAVLKRALTRSI